MTLTHEDFEKYFNITDFPSAEATRVDRIVVDATTMVTNRLRFTPSDATMRPVVMEIANRIYRNMETIFTEEIRQLIADIVYTDTEVGIFVADYKY